MQFIITVIKSQFFRYDGSHVYYYYIYDVYVYAHGPKNGLIFPRGPSGAESCAAYLYTFARVLYNE